MNESVKLVLTLKGELRRQGYTYADLAEVLCLSHASVKRLFAQGNFSLERLETLCRFLGMDMSEMFRLMEAEQAKPEQLSQTQEALLVADTRLLCMAHCVLNRWHLAEITTVYAFSETQAQTLLKKLARLGIIELLSGNRYKLLLSRNFNWLKRGPIERFFETQLQTDYFASSFSNTTDKRIFVSAMLSPASLNRVHTLFQDLQRDINQLHLQDEKLPVGKRRGYSTLLTIRGWEATAFTQLRRAAKSK